MEEPILHDTFHPAAGPHAIVEAAWFFHFYEPVFDNASAALSAMRRSDLEFESMVLANANVTDSADNSSTQMKAVLASKVDEAGNPLYTLSIGQSFVQVTFNQYSRWEYVFTDAIKLLRSTNEIYGLKGKRIKEVGLRFQDAFIKKFFSETETLPEILNKESHLLPLVISSTNDIRFHLNTGFYQKVDGDERPYLNTVQISSRVGEIITTATKLVALDIFNTVSLKFEKSSDTTFTSIDEYVPCFEKMHILNKKTVAGLLSKEAQKEIGLQV